ncbi:MAG: CHAT domain-containing protein [Comamonadaceae bacterium]|nr:CHAT domain-containing protein [Comamonadaceae bacterium]
MRELEDRPSDRFEPGAPGDEALMTFVATGLEESPALMPVMPALRRAGLGAVFVRGETLIASAQAACPDAGFIGFFGYRGLTADGRGFGPRRYVRYTLADDEWTLTDLGAAREIDARVGARRAAVLSRRDAAARQAGVLLRDALLGGSPAGVRDRTRWIVEPDGPLALLPFDALPGQSAPSVIDERCVSQVTSLASLGTGRSGDEPLPSQAACAIADPAFPAPGQERPRASDWRRRLCPRPGAKPMPSPPHGPAWASPFGATSVNRPAARRFRSTGPAPRFLHVAAHGVLLQPDFGDDVERGAVVDSLLPGRSAALVLCDGGAPEFVTAAQLQRLNLRGTELVVLSACDTGNGDVRAGEGLDSLRRAVEVAGARASLTSVWPVPSESTVVLMESFYGRLADGENAAQALRAAKLSVRADRPSPLDWAGFVLAGQA